MIMLVGQAGKCPIPYALSASNTSFSSSCVIESRVTNYMTHPSHQFVTYNPCPGNKKIKAVDDSLATVVVQGAITLYSLSFIKECFTCS